MRENRQSGSMRGGVRRSLASGLSNRRLRLLYRLRIGSWEARAVKPSAHTVKMSAFGVRAVQVVHGHGRWKKAKFRPK